VIASLGEMVAEFAFELQFDVAAGASAPLESDNEDSFTTSMFVEALQRRQWLRREDEQS
jgi:hypothetical protein